MPRSRWLRTLLMFAVLAIVMYILVSLYLPSSHRLIVGVDKRTGYVRRVGAHVTFLPPHRFYRLDFSKREGAAQRDGFIRTESAEHIPVTMSYRVRFSIATTRLPDPRTLVNDGWTAWMGRRVAEAVDAVTRQVSVEELLAPNSRFNQSRDPLRRVVSAHLARSGLNVTAFEIARIEADREALLRNKRAELRRAARGTVGRVAIFAIDGADWDLLSELGADGRIPNLKALMRAGTSGSMQTIQPTVSPMLWTTVATGLPPDRHGVIDFFDRGRNAPVDAYSRRAPALWDIAEAFGRHAMVVNWWTAWPPTSAESFTFDAPVELLPGAIAPQKVTPRARALEIPLQTIGYDQVRRFLNITQAEYDAAVNARDPRDPVNVFRAILAKTWSDHRVAINTYNEQQPTLLMIDYSGTDAVNHLFGPFHPPLRDGVSEENYRRYWPAVANYYAEIDRLIGEWMNLLPADTTVMVVSAHGFRWGKERPRRIPNGAAALSDHRNPGVFIAYGNHVARGEGSHVATLYDLAPTVLAILGLPKAIEMPGNVIGWALSGVAPVDAVRVVSYSEFTNLRPPATGSNIDPRAYQARLQVLGHVHDPSRDASPVAEDEAQPASSAISPAQWGAYAYYNDLGVNLRRQGKRKEAAEAFSKAVQLNPNRPAPYLNLAMVLLDFQQFSNADEMFLTAVQKGLPDAEQWFADYAAWYREHNMTSRAIGILEKGKELFPQSYLIAANLGSALAQGERYTDGLPELERALGLQPSSTLALNNIGMFYARRKDYARALDYWNRSLAIDPRQSQIRSAAEAARSRL